MKVMCVLGSPRKMGNTGTVLSWVEQELEARGHGVDHVNIVDHEVRGCSECYRCQETDQEPGCPQPDEAVPLFERMIQSDAVIFATPLFCWGFSAQLKPLIDRTFCLVTGYGEPSYRSLLEGKAAGLLVTAAGPAEGNTDLIEETFRRYADYAQLRVAGRLIVTHCSTPSELGEATRQRARQFATRIAAA